MCPVDETNAARVVRYGERAAVTSATPIASAKNSASPSSPRSLPAGSIGGRPSGEAEAVLIARLQARIVELEAQLGPAHRELVALRRPLISGPMVSLFELGRGRTSPPINRDSTPE